MNFNKSFGSRLQNNRGPSMESGQISKVLLIGAVIVLVVIVIIYSAIKFTTTKKQSSKSETTTETAEPPEPPKPIYEVTLGDIRFLLESSGDLGNTLKSKTSYEKDFTTTEKFIRVVIGAQNKSKNNIAQYSWDVGNIVDSEGRNFVSINNRVYSYLPRPDLCGALLKPEFEPIPCVKYYEVSKISNNFKIVVKTTQPKKQESLIDLYIP